MKLIAGILMMAMGGTIQGGGPGFQELVPQIVGAARQHALSSSRPGSVAGPVLLDAASFSAAGRSLGESVSPQGMLRGAGQGARAVSGEEGVVCTAPTASAGRRCEVRDRGVLVSVQSVARTATGVDVVVSARWTDRRPSGASATAGHTLRLSFSPRGQSWHLDRKAIVRRS